jgi:hypothetical protein
VLDAGPVHVTAERERTVWIPPVIGAAALIAGVALLAMGGKRA